MHKHSRLAEFLYRVQNGEKKTRSQWMEEYDLKTTHQFGQLIQQLRHHGYPIAPIGTGYNKEGVYCIITDKKEWAQEAKMTHQNNSVIPSIRTSFMFYENIIKSYPELLSVVENDLDTLHMKIIEQKRLNISYAHPVSPAEGDTSRQVATPKIVR